MTSNSNTQIDTKLQHLIHKIIKTSSSPASSPSKSPSASSSAPSSVIVPALPLSSKQILDTLLTKHREYKRKNVTVLKTSIDEILVQFAKSKKLNTGICSKSGSLVIGSNGSGNGSGNNQKKKTVSVPIGQQQRQGGAKQLGNKRKRNEDKQQQQSQQQNQQKRINNSSDDEEEYDRIAVQNDLLVQSLQIQNQANQLEGGNSGNSDSGGSSMLNANLRNRYKDVQRERDVVARKKASTVVVEEDDNDQAEKSSFLPTISEAASSDTITPTPTSRPSTPTTPQSTTRKKKKKLSRSSSSSNLNKASSEQSSSAPFTSTLRPKERYTDLGGLTKTLTQIRQLIEYPLSHPELFAHLGIDPPRGVLFRGPPGCGKTHIANAIAGQLNVTFYKISAPEIVSSMSGESESRLRDLFSIASSTAPSIIFMDEIDAIAPKRGGDGSSSGGSKGMEKRIVAQLLTCMDSLSPENNRNGSPVMVLAATNRPDSIDAALRRAGRFDREIILGVPDEEGRESILRVMTVGMRLSGDIDFKLLAKKTPGYVGADIRSLTKEAGVIAINRIFKKILIPKESLEGAKDPPSKAANNADGDTAMEESQEQEKQEKGNDKQDAKDQKQKAAEQSDDFDIHSVTRFTTEQLEPLSITMKDFLEAVPHVQPSSKREGFATVPDVSWDDIGALQCIREELTLSVLEPIANPEKFKALGLPLPAGVLLYGPPGCGKTLLAKAIANESGANFISVKGPELLDKYVGESERAVRQVFERARSSSPCIVFFDELDSLCPKRGSDSSGGGVSERVVNQLLTEMDGLDTRRSVFVIAATNRPELIDPAMLRPGRLDKLLYVPLPSPPDRVAIIKANAKNIKLGSDVNLESIGLSSRAEGYSGADCAALLREAGLAVLRDDSLSRNILSNKSNGTSEPVSADTYTSLEINAKHFDYAFDHVMPSVSKKDQSRYNRIRDRMARARTRGSVSDDKSQNNENSEVKATDDEKNKSA